MKNVHSELQKKTINLHDALKNKHNNNIYIYITLDYSLYLDYT